jgi:hypothetical protein
MVKTPPIVKLFVTNLTTGEFVELIVKLNKLTGEFTKNVCAAGVDASPIWKVPPVIFFAPAPETK